MLDAGPRWGGVARHPDSETRTESQELSGSADGALHVHASSDANGTGTCAKSGTPLTQTGAGEFASRSGLESLLRIAAEQWPHKSPEDQAIERRFIERDYLALTGCRLNVNR